MTEITHNLCESLDQEDELARFREEFYLPADIIYLDGNSLGAMPRAALDRAQQVISHEWGEDLIKSWNTAGWFHLPYKLGEKIAPLIGAKSHEVVVTDSTGINLYKVLAAALDLNQDRSVIVMEGSNFPTDNYMAQGLVAQLGHRHDIRFAEIETIDDSIDSDVAVVCLTHVHYKTGHILDMQEITHKAQDAGALVVWDLCHSAGAMPVGLNACHADFAVGCTYKYLNGGPGSPAFIFAAERHHGKAQQPLTGWWGHENPFAFEQDYSPATGIGQMLSGTQPIVSLAMTEAGLDITAAADMHAIRQKSQHMTDLFIQLVEEKCGDFGFSLVSPRDATKRGSQVSFNHPDGYPIMKALIHHGVIGDFRAPQNVRFGFAPLYLKYMDVWNAVAILEKIMKNNVWKQSQFQERDAVT